MRVHVLCNEPSGFGPVCPTTADLPPQMYPSCVPHRLSSMRRDGVVKRAIQRAVKTQGRAVLHEQSRRPDEAEFSHEHVHVASARSSMMRSRVHGLRPARWPDGVEVAVVCSRLLLIAVACSYRSACFSGAHALRSWSVEALTTSEHRAYFQMLRAGPRETLYFDPKETLTSVPLQFLARQCGRSRRRILCGRCACSWTTCLFLLVGGQRLCGRASNPRLACTAQVWRSCLVFVCVCEVFEVCEVCVCVRCV